MSDNTKKIIKIAAIVLGIIAVLMVIWFVVRGLLGKGSGDNIFDAGDVELEWWVLWEDAEDIQVLVDLYEQQHPNVSIKVVPQIETQYKEKVQSQLGSTEGPDIVRIHNTWTPKLISTLFPLPSSVMSESEYASTFYNTALLDFKAQDGNIYAIPLMFDGLGVYYNKKLLKQEGYSVPEDAWDDFVLQAKALTKYDSDGNIRIAGAGIGSADNVDFSFDILSLLMLQEGTPLDTTTGSIAVSQDGEMRAAKAIKFYTDFVNRHRVWERSLARDITMFSEGRLAMMFAPSWRVFDINAALKNAGATLDYDIAPVPQQPTETGEGVNWASYWGEVVSAGCEHPEVAWDFIKFITEQDQLKTFYNQTSKTRAFGEIYPRKDMANELINGKYVGAYVKMAKTARSWRMVDKEAVSSAFDQLIESIASEEQTDVDGIHNRLQEVETTVNGVIGGN